MLFCHWVLWRFDLSKVTINTYIQGGLVTIVWEEEKQQKRKLKDDSDLSFPCWFLEGLVIYPGEERKSTGTLTLWKWYVINLEKWFWEDEKETQKK